MQGFLPTYFYTVINSNLMEIKQFEDKHLSHYSYAIMSNGEIALVDPARNPEPYYEYARTNNAKIIAVIETHPHADFVSSHLEIHKTTGATLYTSKLTGADYPHQPFDDGDAILLGHCTLKSMNTPGHSPDSITIVAFDEQEKAIAAFTGDTLFIGDCGRPDLREQAGAITSAREDLAKQMYHSLREKLMPLPDDVLIYPAHGAGSLCGKGLSSQNSSTLGNEKLSNWSLQEMTEDYFVRELLADQPFIPKYFPYEVGINKAGANGFAESLSKVRTGEALKDETSLKALDPSLLIIDTRPQEQFKNAHLRNAINLMDDTRFETWLGSIVNPGEKFYLLAQHEKALQHMIERCASIGYESQIESAHVAAFGNHSMPFFDSEALKNSEDHFTIIDVRNESEVKTGKIFANAIHIPLHELRERTNEIPLQKPIVVHCAGGYRSAAGSTILRSALKEAPAVYDLSESIKTFKK